MDRTIGGLPVLGGDVVVHQAEDGTFKGASLTLSRSADVSRTPKVSVATATATSKALAKGLKAEGKPALVIEARKGAPRLAYLVTTVGTQPDGTCWPRAAAPRRSAASRTTRRPATARRSPASATTSSARSGTAH